MQNVFTTKTEAIDQYIIPALGDFADDYDTDGIFSEAFEYSEDERGFVLSIDEDDFYDVAAKYDISE